MKIDMTITFNGASGLKMLDSANNILILRTVIAMALKNGIQGVQDTPKEKKEMFKLWEDKIQDKDEGDLTFKEAILIKDRIELMFDGNIVGPVDKIIKDK